MVKKLDCASIVPTGNGKQGRWESLEMVQRYTRSVTSEDSLKRYREAG